MNLELIEAGPSEIDLLMKWRMEVISVVFEDEPYDRQALYENNYNYYKKALKDSTYLGLFAKIKDEIVGCGGACLYSELPSPDNPSGNCAYLMNIYVRKSHRNKGIASQIVKALIKKAKQRNVGKIYLESTEEAYPMYRKLGFSPMRDFLILN